MQTIFLEDVIEGLSKAARQIPSKYFYDRAGSELFDRITELPEYYLTRTELAIMRENVGAIGRLLGDDVALIEYGSGSSTKTRMLLDRIPAISTYIPIDISGAHLADVADDLSTDYPELSVLPVHADYSSDVRLPEVTGRRVVYFPGSTIGNFEPARAAGFLRRMRSIAGDGGGALVGVDLKKDTDVLQAAYDDASGVTAEFNLNVLRRINRELGADFDLGGFDHQAVYNEDEGRVEMHLVSSRKQSVCLAGRTFRFGAGDGIHTENSYKYDIDQFAGLAGESSFLTEQVWTDERSWFALFLLRTTN